ncbi:MAG: D-TA family PLP-dependent enzyme [Lachnospiraceae bacterium]|nr:D-TA family PLP-dependent enzyme [Lachnospiraceae bacterium]
MEKHGYEIKDTDSIVTPALIYYKGIINENLDKMVSVAGNIDRLWPHVKSHKMEELVRLQITKGITKFKCATIAEAEMVAVCGAKEAVIAYPLIGPNMDRFLDLCKAFPETRFWAIGDDFASLKALSDKACGRNRKVDTLIDVNMGTNRTGIRPDRLYDLYKKCQVLPGLLLDGLHCYDGNHGIEDYDKRMEAVKQVDKKVFAVADQLKAEGIKCTTLIMGGTPSFPCHAHFPQVYMSPGTCVVSDYGYFNRFKDENFIPAGILMTRVVSHPEDGYFTIDLGYKGIAADPPGQRGKLLGVEHASSVGQNEEHWIWKMDAGYEKEMPKIGTVLYVIPTHICPTSALYPEALVAENGSIVDRWRVTARNRKLTW